ncbi:hypothetical protein MPER_13780, partial [Moniliophthora perniciosa FA553]
PAILLALGASGGAKIGSASRHITVASYDPPTSMHVVVRYFDSFGEAAHIAVTLRMHEESSYEGLDPIECEVRRRIFWLLFG